MKKPKKNARQHASETHFGIASTTPAMDALTPIQPLPGSLPSARHVGRESQIGRASTTPAMLRLNSTQAVPGSPSNARHPGPETHVTGASATPAGRSLNSTDGVPGSPIRKGRRAVVETHKANATSTPATRRLEPISSMPGSPLSSIVEAIRAHHRERRFAMGIQQVLDRKLESYIRINKTDWHIGDDETARAKANKEVAAKIKAARANKGDPSIIKAVQMTDHARGPADAERARHEKEMVALAQNLPVAPWVESIPGFGLLGLATIVAETGDLSNYANVGKVWKRLGYAPYKGRAGSSWKRPSWHKGDPALTKEEWIANPFAGMRYSLIHVVSVWLKNKQWIGAAKTDDGVGKPDGKYGEIYAERRAHTAVTHQDWTKQHAHMDGLRIMMKEVLKDLWIEWNQVERKSVDRQSMCEAQAFTATIATPAIIAMKSNPPLPGSPLQNARRGNDETHCSDASVAPASEDVKPNAQVPGSTANARQRSHEAQRNCASETPTSEDVKPIPSMPGSPFSSDAER